MVIKPKILSQEPLSMTEVLDELKKLEKKKGELNYRANKTYDYLKQMNPLKKKDAKELFDKIMALGIPRLKEQHAKKIIDIMPKTEQELSIMFYGGTTTITKDSIKKILDVLKDY
jgi:DNA-directed RNA polymerase subunit F